MSSPKTFMALAAEWREMSQAHAANHARYPNIDMFDTFARADLKKVEQLEALIREWQKEPIMPKWVSEDLLGLPEKP